MTKATRSPRLFKFRWRSFHALVVKPEIPISGWLAEADAWLARSPGFFAGKAVVIDVSGLSQSKGSFASLVEELKERDVHISGIEGAGPSWANVGLPILMTNGQATREAAEAPAVHLPAPVSAPSSLLIDMPVRSGQSIVNPDGDVTIVGSVASGAEIVAAGSIHVYGALRGRVLAGAYGNPGARIFCRQLEAELLAINGHYSVADELEPHLRKTPIQAWLEADELKIMTMN
jgi:septum site-determining protein MinC